MSEASNKVKFYLSGGFYSQKGVYIDNSAERFTLRTNIDYRLINNITMGDLYLGMSVKITPLVQAVFLPGQHQHGIRLMKMASSPKAPGYIGGVPTLMEES